MAILKNNQERQQGEEAGAIRQSDYTMTQLGDSISHTSPLYTCSSTNDSSDILAIYSNCITKKDFLIPPVNIPVIAREGIIRTDINLPISRENLQFANSKTILVFRILPADPMQMKCKDGTSGLKCANNKAYDLGYDWKNTLPILRPAKEKYYDMFIYTYKTPFIPSLWNNWNIAGETFSFSKLKNIYLLTDKADSKYTETENEEQRTDAANYPDCMERIGQKTICQSAITKRLEQVPVSETEKKINEKKTSSTHELFDPEKNKNKVVETNILNALTIGKKLETVNNLANSMPCPIVYIGGKAYPVLPKDSNCKCPPSVQNKQPLEESTHCANQRKKQNEIDLSNQHIAHFAASNALCVIPINSKSNVKTCGNFSSSKEIEQDFLESLNKQITIINTAKKESLIANYVSPHLAWLRSSEIGDSSSPNKLSATELKKILVNDHKFSKSFRNKVTKLPTLPDKLLVQNIENIIQSGIDTHNMDLNQVAFIHALCGFWFEKFYTDYTNTELLKDALKKTVKNTFYYKLRGINPLPATTNNTSEENNTSNNNINNAMDDLQIEYTNYLKDMRLKGDIDDVHNWVNGEKEYGFDSNFHHRLEQRLEEVSKKSPFCYTYTFLGK